LFVVEQTGVIRELVDGALLDRPFLDITRYVSWASETGPLGLAFAPAYATSGRFYVYFNDHVGNGDVNVVEFRRSTGDPEVADPDRQVLTIEKPWGKHNAGIMESGLTAFSTVRSATATAVFCTRPGHSHRRSTTCWATFSGSTLLPNPTALRTASRRTTHSSASPARYLKSGRSGC
jgi:hypothetical protein